MKNRYLCYSDTHFNFTFPWTRYSFVEKIKEENPSGLFLTGDIACGLTIEQSLRYIAKHLENTSIYFILGNHDYYGKSISENQARVRKLCTQYKNLHWVSDESLIKLTDDVGLIAEDGWYDARLGNPAYIVYNFDWIMIDEFRKLSSFEEKFKYTQYLADISTEKLKTKLEKALEECQTIYIMTHMPPWREAVRSLGSDFEDFWLPYNINYKMGEMIENIMKDKGNQNVVVLSGHTHLPAFINVSHNVECVIQGGKYFGAPTDHNSVFI